MNAENKVAVQIPAATKAEIHTKVTELQALLMPFLISLTPEQRRTALKMGDASEPFVGKVIEYAKTDPTYLPPFFQVEDIEIDFNAVKDLLAVARPLAQVEAALSDTILQSGSEAYTAALGYYRSVQYASQANVMGAKTIYEELKKRFEKSGKKKAEAVAA